jgi:hypothetical protein
MMMKQVALVALVVVVVAFRMVGGPATPQPRARLPRGFAAPEGRAWPPAVELIVHDVPEGR